MYRTNKKSVLSKYVRHAFVELKTEAVFVQKLLK
jgi:hypothetical protein